LETQRRAWRAFLAAALGAGLFIAMVLAWNSYPIRSDARWFARAHRYKAEVMAQPVVNGQLKRLEWDGWGGIAVSDWTVYVVFDPPTRFWQQLVIIRREGQRHTIQRG
jgi:hypothetical protein